MELSHLSEATTLLKEDLSEESANSTVQQATGNQHIHPLEDRFILHRNKTVILSLSGHGLQWSIAVNRNSTVLRRRIALADIIAVRHTVMIGLFRRKARHYFVVHTFERNRRRKCVWKCIQLRFKAQNAQIAQRWVEHVTLLLTNIPDRPRHLWVFVNPYGGDRKAVRIWKHQVLPLFALADIVTNVVVTQHANEAFDRVKTAPLSTLESYDGIVVVGGDGLFQEILNGLLQKKDTASTLRIRLGHIPAGSTDAVAMSVNGSRCPISAALRIVLGDRMKLDVMHIRSESTNFERYSACLAGYGFMGDVIFTSEKLRLCGPLRYDIAGAIAFFRRKIHKARISYIPADENINSHEECLSSCSWCQVCSTASPNTISYHCSQIAGAAPSIQNSSREVVREGEFMSVMIVAMPCRSDKTPNGIVQHAHLSDGRMQLVLVSKCRRLQYLSFLITLSKRGARREGHSFVEVIDASQIRVEPVNGSSSWNIDGELFTGQSLTATPLHGLIEIFARGIEKT